MLTRLRVKGFKNLVDVDIRFGPFTCIAGPNGAGKSNLFDAITFLGDLASMSIMKAASQARGTNGRISDFHSLFFKDSKGTFLPMVFIAEMIVPSRVIDDFDREAIPTATFLEYTLELRLSETHADSSPTDPIYIEQECLLAINSSEAEKHLGFNPEPGWIKKTYLRTWAAAYCFHQHRNAWRSKPTQYSTLWRPDKKRRAPVSSSS